MSNCDRGQTFWNDSGVTLQASLSQTPKMPFIGVNSPPWHNVVFLIDKSKLNVKEGISGSMFFVFFFFFPIGFRKSRV